DPGRATRGNAVGPRSHVGTEPLSVRSVLDRNRVPSPRVFGTPNQRRGRLMSPHFQFLSAEWPDVYEAATKAEAVAHPDPRTSCFYARRALEILVHWTYKHDNSLRLPYQDNLSALIHEPTFK